MEEACTYNLAEPVRLSNMIPNFRVWVFGRLNAHYVFHKGVNFKQNKIEKITGNASIFKIKAFICLFAIYMIALVHVVHSLR